MLTFALYAGSRDGKNPVYKAQAMELGDLLGRHPCMVKFGGSKIGLMGAFAEAFNRAATESNSGAKLFGVITEMYYDGKAREEYGFDFRLVETLRERKHMLIEEVEPGVEKAEAFICLPGGTGTLDELFEPVEMDTMSSHGAGTRNIRPIFLLNAGGYYNLKIDFLRHGQAEGLIGENGLDFLQIAPDAQTLYRQIGQAFSLS